MSAASIQAAIVEVKAEIADLEAYLAVNDPTGESEEFADDYSDLAKLESDLAGLEGRLAEVALREWEAGR